MVEFNGVIIPKDDLDAFCRKNGVRRSSLFGSILRDDFGPDSEIDVLVNLQPATGDDSRSLIVSYGDGGGKFPKTTNLRSVEPCVTP